jgi:S-DNA-T family DNA segregation ATPase FtsK/SpoIIIE
MARWLAGQLSVLQSPRDLQLYVLTDPGAAPLWSPPPAAAAATTPAGGGSRSPVVRTVAWIVLWAVAAGVLLLIAWRVARHLRAVLAARA